MFWKAFFISLLLFFGAFNPQTVSAKDFSTDISVDYSVDITGKAKVTHSISLENETSELLANTYILNLHSIDPNNIVVKKGEELLDYELKKENDVTKVLITFTNPTPGKGNKTNFLIEYDINNFAIKSGEIWEISIPRLSENNTFRSYNVYLSVPVEFGDEAYVAPAALDIKKESGKNKYYFNKETVEKSGISAGFGKFQVFNFSLTYHLENPLNKSSETEIAIPPDTGTQKLYYYKIDPKPTRIVRDDDGNWIAAYRLKPRERVDISVQGSVEIFSTSHNALAPYQGDLVKNTEPTEFWQSDDPEIKKLAAELKTPEAIYNYVVNTLQYNYDQVKPNVVRLGAKNSLKNPASAICMEFTDLFIALARAANIPAREINGYAYTENPTIQPLSLVADVLHSWPEYWNEEKKTWIPIDPTWGNTTRGVDYFNKLDLRHFAFVIHGASDTKPFPPGSYKLGANPEKDVYVSFGQLPEERSGAVNITFDGNNGVSLFKKTINVTLENTGSTAIYTINPTVLLNNEKIETKTLEVLPPFSSYSFPVTIKGGILGPKPPSLTVVAGIKVATLPSSGNSIIIWQLILVSFLLTLIVLTALLINHTKIVNYLKKKINGKRNKSTKSANSQ